MSGNQEGSALMTTTAQQTEAATAVASWLAEFSAALVAGRYASSADWTKAPTGCEYADAATP